MLGDELHLFLKDGAGTVSGEDEKGADGTLSGVQVFIETSSYSGLVERAMARVAVGLTQIVGLEDEQHYPRHVS